MEFHPHPYQEKAIEHILEHPEAGVFLDLGLGKTICSLTAVSEILYDRFECRKCLVIAPKKVAQTVWSSEAAYWNHTRYLTVSKVLGTEHQRVRALFKKADIYVINRDNVKWLVDYYGKHWKFDLVIIDELSSFKSHDSQRFRALRKVRPFFNRVIGLTGTPAPNGLLDLWSQIYLLDMGERLGTRYTAFREKYFEPDREGWVNGHPKTYSYKPRPGAKEEIFSRIADICVSMSSHDWLQLKEPIHRVVRVELSKKSMSAYRQLERDMLLPLKSSDIIAAGAAVLSNKLLQLSNGAVYDENHRAQEIHEDKLEMLDELVEALNGQRALIYYAFRHDLERIKRRFPKAVELRSDQDIKRWNLGEIPLLLAHPASAGHGLNLQKGGHHIIWFSAPWNLEWYQQANGRLARQGQTEQVFIHHLVASGTLDEQVLVSLDNKEEGQDALLRAIKARIEEVQGTN